MNAEFQALLKILEWVAATADAAAKAKMAYQSVRAAYQQTHELTPEQKQELDQKADAIFASEANKPSGR